MRLRTAALALVALALALLAAGCGGGEEETNGGATVELSGRVRADGSSTVGPFATRAAERFQREHPGARVTVGVSGTGGGFERFCAGETDLSNASRPMKDEERRACEQKGIDYVEFEVANDALTVVVNKDNEWASCLTAAQLKKIWEPGSKVKRWDDLDPTFPDRKLTLYGPGTDSGTFDYFTETIVGEEGASRADYAATEDDNVIVQGVSGDAGALGYFGFSYFEENRERLKAAEVDGGDGCVAPSVETAQNGTYTPLSRRLYIYAKTKSFTRREVAEFVRYTLANARSIAEESQYVPLTERQVGRAERDYRRAVRAAGGTSS